MYVNINLAAERIIFEAWRSRYDVVTEAGRSDTLNKGVEIRIFLASRTAACLRGLPARYGLPKPCKGPVYTEFHLSASPFFPFKTSGGTRVAGGVALGVRGRSPAGARRARKAYPPLGGTFWDRIAVSIEMGRAARQRRKAGDACRPLPSGGR